MVHDWPRGDSARQGPDGGVETVGHVDVKAAAGLIKEAALDQCEDLAPAFVIHFEMQDVIDVMSR